MSTLTLSGGLPAGVVSENGTRSRHDATSHAATKTPATPAPISAASRMPLRSAIVLGSRPAMTPTSARSAISWAVKSMGGYPAVPATIAVEGDESAAGGPRGPPHRGSYSRSYGPHAGYSITSSAIW
ncbi:MAG: hypothetical protein WBM12_07465 [Pseudolabrys sp.]